jgi:hypothetical protein
VVEAARMKGMRTPFVFLAVALVLGGYIFLIERHSATSDDAALNAKKVVPKFERDKVTHIETAGVVLDKKGESWRITKPADFSADPAAIDDLLSGVEFLEAKRVIEGKPNPAEYGLDKPAFVLKLGDVQLAIGKDDATGKGVYVQRAGDARVFVVDRHIVAQVNNADGFRDKRVFVLDRASVKKVEVDAVTLTHENNVWRLKDGVRADAAKVGDLLKAIEDLRIEKFSECAVKRNIAVDGTALPKLCIKGLDKVAAENDSLRDRALLAMRDPKSIAIESGGKKVALSHEDGGWKITAPQAQAADDEAVRKWIDDVFAYRALGFKPVAGNFPTTVTLDKDVIHVSAPQGGRVFVRRGEEPVMLEMHAEVAQQFAPDPMTFRSRKILSFVRFDARKLVTNDEIAVKGEADTWKLEKPAGVEADADVMDKLLGALGDLRAEKFVAAPPQKDVRKLTVTVEPPAGAKGEKPKAETHTVEIAADCIARADDGPSFVVAKEHCGELRAHLATRKLLTLAEDKLTGLEIQRGGKKETAEKRGPAWYLGDTQVDQSKIDALVTLLRGLSAQDAVAYGPANLAPRLSLRVKTDGAPDAVLIVAADGRARVSGRDVTYQLPKDSVAQLEKSSLE